MTLITDILDYEALQDEIRAGYVTERFHPEFPELAILNYTDKAQFDGHWNEITRNTRGLIYNRDTLTVVARGFPKWFNYGDPVNAPQVGPDDPIEGAYIKWDGSLGILYATPNGTPAIATRGSFESDQAKHATGLLHKSGRAWQQAEYLDSGLTPVYEIVYAENRIVVDYGDRDELIPLGWVHIPSGVYHPSKANRVEAATIRDVLTKPYHGDEGFIVKLSDGTIIKWKHDQYKELHRVVSNLTVKEVWRQLRAGTIDDFAAALPDEFHQWARDTVETLDRAAGDAIRPAIAAYQSVKTIRDRKSQALWVNANVPAGIRGIVFMMLDGKDYRDAVWRMVEPKGAQPMRQHEEAA